MKKFLFVAAVLMIAGCKKAEAASVNFEGNRVVVSTVPTAPTLLVSADSNLNIVRILNDSGYNLVLSTSSVSVSTSATTGGFYVPHGTLFDVGGGQDYRGSVYGVLSGTTTPQSVGVFKTK